MSEHGYGTVPLFGNSKALDLLQGTQGSPSSQTDCLLVGSLDARNILLTSSRAWRHGYNLKDINFFVIESQAPLIARQLLLLSILLEHIYGKNPEEVEEMGTQERIELFLELFGNLLLRPKTGKFLSERATELIKVVSGDSQHIITKFIDLSQLRYREKDDLEFVFKFWRGDSKKINQQLAFHGIDFWESRCRSFYGSRYESRDNVINWDYHMNLKDKVSIIHEKEFLKWRMNGNAYEVRESNYNCPNRTFATVDGLKQNGLTVPKWGYFSDISSGPFYSFGIDAENKELLKTANDKHIKTSQDIAEYNLKSMVHELSHSTLYSEDNIQEINATVESNGDKFKVTFLPCDASITFLKKAQKYKSKFKRIFLSSSMAHYLLHCKNLLSEDGMVIVETARYMLDLNKAQEEEYIKKVVQMGQDSGLQLQITDDKSQLEFLY